MPFRPEDTTPPDLFYSETEAKKYMKSSRMSTIQTKLAERCFEMLMFPKKCSPLLLLDIGCGTGLSGEVLEKHGHHWIGCDISRDMLHCAKEREVEGDLICSDMGDGLPFRPGVFDGAISVSAIQWLCTSFTKAQNPRKRITDFFRSLHRSLRQGGRAALQFYPKDERQVRLLCDTATKVGFGGGLVVDFPNSTKARKYYMCIWAGLSPGAFQQQVPQPKTGGNANYSDSDSDDDGNGDEGDADGEDEEMDEGEGGEEGEEGSEEEGAVDPYGNEVDRYRRVQISERQKKQNRTHHRKPVKALNQKEWIMWRKEKRRVKGLKTANDSKYSTRKRGPRF